MCNSILAEIWEGRRQRAERFRHDLTAMFDDLRLREADYAGKVLTTPLKPRRQVIHSTEPNTTTDR